MPHPVFERRPQPNTDLTAVLQSAFQDAGIINVNWTYSRAHVQEDVNQQQLDKLAGKGLKPLKFHDYEISPMPTMDQKLTLVQIWGSLPVGTVHRENSIEIGLEKALDQNQIQAIKDLNFTIKSL